MTTFDDVVSKAKNVAETAGKKTSDFIEVTRLKIEAAEIEKDISSILEGLGRLIYDGRKQEQDVTSLVDDCIAKVDERNADLEKVRAKIDVYKNLIRCKNCGEMNSEDAVYCKKCGAKVRE